MDYIILILSIIALLIGIICFIQGKKKEKLTITKAIEKYKQLIKNQTLEESQKLNKFMQLTQALSQDCENLEKQVQIQQRRAQEAETSANKIIASKQENMRLQTYQLDQDFNKQRILKEDELQNYINELIEDLNSQYSYSKYKLENQLTVIKNELNEYKTKRDAINEQLRKEEQLQNEQNFYRIQLSDNNKDDIHYLMQIEQNVHNKELLHKLIWSEYLQKPFTQLLKNITGNKSPKNVIYCIENINNHKKYIGKTRGEYKDRQINHIKASLSISTISHQLIHEALFGHWDEFMFYILEEVKDEDKLGEREAYYINFYETNVYGYNQKAGG